MSNEHDGASILAWIIMGTVAVLLLCCGLSCGTTILEVIVTGAQNP